MYITNFLDYPTHANHILVEKYNYYNNVFLFLTYSIIVLLLDYSYLQLLSTKKWWLNFFLYRAAFLHVLLYDIYNL